LYIEIRPTGAKLWRYRYRIESIENLFAMGEYFRDAATPGHVLRDSAGLALHAVPAVILLAQEQQCAGT